MVEEQEKGSVMKDEEKSQPLPIKKKKINKHRCYFCNKKYGMISFTCECNGTFCIVCCSAHTHKCPIDRKKMTKIMLEKKNPKVVHAKMVDVLG